LPAFSSRLARPRVFAAAWLVLSTLSLSACQEPTISRPLPPPQEPVLPPVVGVPVEPTSPVPVPPPPPVSAEKLRVALLLPLSGQNAALGAAMLDAAQMALFDVVGDDRLELLPRDTQGKPDVAAEAAKGVIADGARLIVGPLLAAEVSAVKPIARAANVPVLAFSTATQLAGTGTYLMGFTPNQEIVRVTAYAHEHGHDRFAVLAPRSPYGELVADAVKDAAATDGATLVRVEFYDPGTNDMAAAVRRFAGEGHDYDALFLPEGDGRLKTLAPQLPYFDIDPGQVKFLGTGLWDEPGLGTEPALDGAWYAAPPPSLRANFEKRYRALYKTAPPRLATLGYDATALAAVLARAPQGADFSDAALTNPNGFSGVDGIFRLRPDGLVQRGLGILEVHRGGGTVIDPAPQSFQDLGQ
jgi:branched-chain amino acid transport system substrate-binding protein